VLNRDRCFGHQERILHVAFYSVSQSIPDVIDCNLKKDYPILIIFCSNIDDTTGHQMTVGYNVPTSPNFCFCTTRENVSKQNAKICVEMNKKNVNEFNLSGSVAPTAGRLQGLTVMQRWVYQMTFRNVDEFKKRLVKSAWVWSRTLSTLLSTNRESVSVPVFA